MNKAKELQVTFTQALAAHERTKPDMIKGNTEDIKQYGNAFNSLNAGITDTRKLVSDLQNAKQALD